MKSIFFTFIFSLAAVSAAGAQGSALTREEFAQFREEFSAFREEVKQEFAATKAEVSVLKSEISALQVHVQHLEKASDKNFNLLLAIFSAILVGFVGWIFSGRKKEAEAGISPALKQQH